MTLSDFATVLENTTKKQCKGHMEKEGLYCALGVAQFEIPFFNADDFNEKCRIGTGYTVTMMNDIFEWDFKQIALYIRAMIERRRDASRRVCNLA